MPLRLRRGRVAGQPGDGSCLFHSLRFGLSKGGAGGHLPTTQGLRRELAQWVATNSQRKIAETPLAMWVKWDSGQTAQSYGARMARGGWGGGIEMAACAHLKRVNVWVYEANKKQARNPKPDPNPSPSPSPNPSPCPNSSPSPSPSPNPSPSP